MATVQAPLAGRYRFSRRIQAGAARTIAWLAIDEQTGAEVVASPLTGPRLAGLVRALGVEHAHLTPLLDLIRDPAPDTVPDTDTSARVAAVGIAQYLPGRTLHEELKSGALDPHDAVTTVLHIAEALTQLHRSGAVHGAVSPRSVIVTPTQTHLSPVLTQLVAPTSGAYSTPERLRGHGPNIEDDVWALYSTLHASLVAGVPFSGGTREELVENMLAGKLHQLSEFGIEDEALQQILVEGLTAARGERQAGADRFHERLTGWLRDNGYAERDSVVSERENVASTHTEPPVSVYEEEEEDDMTRVFIRSSGDAISAVPWSIPINQPVALPVGDEPKDAAPSSPANETATSEPASAEPAPVPAPLMIASPSDAVFPTRKPRRRIDSMILDPFTLTGFSDPSGDAASTASLKTSSSSRFDGANSPENEAKKAASDQPPRSVQSIPEHLATGNGGVIAQQAEPSQLGRSGIIKLAMLGILIGTGITTCVALTR